MRGRACWGGALLVVMLGCASDGVLTRAESIEPTEEKPVQACAVLCKDGHPMFYSRQHICANGANRQSQDVQLIGTILDKWIVCGVYNYKERRCEFGRELPKADVELMTCDRFWSGVKASRDTEQRGRNDGDEWATPKPLYVH